MERKNAQLASRERERERERERVRTGRKAFVVPEFRKLSFITFFFALRTFECEKVWTGPDQLSTLFPNSS